MQQQSGFAGSVSSDKGNRLAVGDAETDAPKGDRPVRVGKMQVIRFDNMMTHLLGP
jgi:hypothetical protein